MQIVFDTVWIAFHGNGTTLYRIVEGVNPPENNMVSENNQLIYLADKPCLPEA